MKKFPNLSRLQSSLEMIKTKIFLFFIVFLFSSLNVFSQNSESISNCNDFVVGSAAAWPYVLVATTIDSGAVSHLAQTFTMNVTSLPASGANVRVYKTVANGNDFFGNPITLTLGSNSITVPAVTFDRAVKFQFSSGEVEFDALSLNGVDSDCVDVLPPSNTSLISSCNDFITGPNLTWPYVLVATTIDSGSVSQGAQTFTINITSLPTGGANFRVYKTVANGNDFFGNPITLANGMNTFTVPAVTFDRAVKFQFSSGDIEFNALSLNGVDSDCITDISSIQTTEHKIILNTFPNPSNGSLFFQSNQPIDEIQIHDISGRVVLEVKPQLNIYHIQTTHLKNQLYFVKCLINQDWITRKIILN